MKMDIKNMVKDFSKLGEAKEKTSIYVKMVTVLCAVIVTLVLAFMSITLNNVTSKILVVNTGGEFLKLKSEDNDKLYKSLLQSHCNAVCYYINSFDRNSITKNQASATFLVDKSCLNTIVSKYLNDKAYAAVADRGVVYKCKFEKLQRVEIKGDEYNTIFTSILTIYDGADVKNIRIISRGNAIRVTPTFPENVSGFFFRTYEQEYELLNPEEQ